MKQFHLSKRSKEDVYLSFKYRDLIERHLNIYYIGKLELERINRFTNYSESLFQIGDTEGALDALHTALKAAPNNARCHNNLGVFHWITGNLETAVEYFASARLLDPNHRDTVWNCGQVMADAKEYLTAKYIYNQYMAHNGYDEEMASEIASL
jgi:Tfp pilus assembly protein PilF